MQIHNSPETTVIFSAHLLEFMGFPRKMIVKKELDRVGSKPFDVSRGLNLMYVHCDVASHGIVGDTKTPLLRVFNPVERHGDLVSAKHESVKDDFAFLWEHAIFRHPPNKNHLTNRSEILHS
jgi:hypothetical protein